MLSLCLSIIETPEEKTLFEIMYYEYRDILFARARSILRDDYLAEDAVHVVFVRIANSFNTIKNKLISEKEEALILKTSKINDMCPNVGGYLVIMVKNACYDIMKKNNRAELFFTDREDFIDIGAKPSDVVVSAEDTYLANETLDAIYDAIRRLGESQREVLYMHIVLEMNAREISEMIGCSYEAARKRIMRGRAELRTLIREDGRV